ncbi:hypothetical protein RFN57_03540 [Streptomyces violaceochromogenes]|uniref:ATP/GTP-binding protein n=1 Tax=Streptomyces violaceochromogenes TaxID=67377 RepID=A0ABU6LPG7_9ACTN|nr:hypothetical protein [Streptomyces violaceochromogenes]MEC7051379.1 hypothetical protein [Streptomyces violaceochromogenes]GHC94192.1 hypothetical protein GCM10010309_79290 [Streptomyces violaceochromogenes]
MIRLPSTHAAITAPLVVSSAAFPGVPIGRSLLDGRPFHLSPVLTDMAVLPSTNSLALGGLGSGKSTTDKTWIRREILDHGHQAVIIDNFGEDQSSGEWAPLTRSLGGRVIQAGSFTLNPCSELFTPEVREQLVRSLILAVDPDALTTHSTHALQHALTHPKATSLNGVVDALVQPEDGRWPAATLADWGVNAAIALSRYTEGSLQGLFDGQDASLPETDLPITSFDFSRMDRNSPAIPSLMAAVSCWVEHVWLPQSTAAHRHLVLEEAWQILLSPATAELIQRLMKNSRRAALSIKALMHTLSDLGTDRAQDLARLCEIAHVGRLGPEEAAKVGALLGLPAWAIDRIPRLGPGEAVWKVGPDYVDIVKTILTEEEARLTDTSSRRRKAQQAMTADPVTTTEPLAQEQNPDQDDFDHDDDLNSEHLTEVLEPVLPDSVGGEAGDWDWEMPPNVIDTRHQDALQAAREGRCSEAADLAALGERQDIAAHGINSEQAVSWLATRAKVAELCGNLDQATQLRATVARMGKDSAWFERTAANAPTEPQWHRGPDPAVPEAPAGYIEPVKKQRRTWPYVAAVAALAIGIAGVWQKAEDDEREQKAAAYKGRSGASLTIDGVEADVVARWSRDRDRVILELRASFEPNSKYLRIDASGKSAHSVREDGWYPKAPELSLPVEDHLADVTVRVAIGGKAWKEGSRADSRTVRLSPTGVAYDAETGEKLPSDL